MQFPNLFLLLALAMVVVAGPARAVDPRLSAVHPPGVQSGTETELRFNGNRLDKTQEILLYRNGVDVLAIEESKDKQVRVKVRIAADCPLGEHQVRLRTPGGVTELRTFYVGPFPVVSKETERKKEDPPQALKLNTTVYGSVEKESVDRFQVSARKGQRLSAEVESMRLGRGFYDPYVSILDKEGRILARSDDTALFIQDCFATTEVPEDGDYFVEIRETSYDAIGLYRLHVGTFPRPTAVYPAGGKAGETVNVSFIDARVRSFTDSVKVPSPSPFTFGVFPRQEGVVAPSWNRFRIVDFPNVLEQEPNDDLKQATPTDQELPLAFNGIIEKEGDMDWFRFKAKKGQQYHVRVQGRSLRSPLDSILLITDAKGKSLSSNDDAGGPDSYARFNVPEDGEYHLRIVDHLRNGGPDYVYRVEFSRIEPDLSVYVPDVRQYDTQTRKSVVVARGNRFPLELKVRRSDFKGSLRMTPQDFPEGITLHADELPDGKDTLTAVFEAAADAPVGGRLARVTASLVNPKEGQQVTGSIWQNYDLVQNGNQGVYYQTWVDRIAVAVVEELPYNIRLEVPKAPLVRNGTLPITVVAEREEGFEEAIRVRMLTRPPGLSCTSEITIPKGKTSAVYNMSANGSAEIKVHQIAMLGRASVKGGDAYVSTQLTPLRIADSFVVGKIPMAKTIQGEPVQVKCELTQKEPFEGKAKVELVGLPPGTKAEPREISKDDKEIIFDVTTTKDARKGLHRSLFCRLTLDYQSDKVSQSFGGRGTLRIDKPPPPPEPEEEKEASKGKGAEEPSKSKSKSKK